MKPSQTPSTFGYYKPTPPEPITKSRLIKIVLILGLSLWSLMSKLQISVSVLLSLAIVNFLYLYFRNIYKYWLNLGVQCSKPFPLVGHTLRRLGISMHILEFYDDAYYHHNGKDFSGFFEFTHPGLIVGNLELIKNIVVKDFDHFAYRRVLPLAKVNPIANEMLTNATGDNWRRIKSSISPVFTSHKMKQLYPLICQQAKGFEKLLQQIGKDQQEIEMRKVCGQFSMDTIASCAFGIECEAMNSDRAEFAKMASKIFVLSPVRAVKLIILMIAPVLAQWVELLGFDFTSEEFHFFQNVVSKTVRLRKEKGIWRGDFLDLMKDTKKLSETTMTSQAILFLLAGHNNIASALSFTLHLLAMNPDVQRKLRKELLNAKRENEEDIDYEVLQRLPFLNAVVNESLRIFPVDPTLERVCTKDYQIPGTRVTIKKGQPVLIPIWSIHHDPEYWPEPDLFKPERFFNDNDNGAFMPFGDGPRQCIGMKFVYIVVKTGLSRLLLSQHILPSPNTLHPPPLSPRGFLSVQPIKGLPLTILPIQPDAKH